MGFVDSFVSSVRYAPIANRGEDWTRLKLHNKKPLIFAGTEDPIIVFDELKEDVTAVLGTENMDFVTIAGGAHDFPLTNLEQVLSKIADSWKLE